MRLKDYNGQSAFKKNPLSSLQKALLQKCTMKLHTVQMDWILVGGLFTDGFPFHLKLSVISISTIKLQNFWL